MQEAFPRVSPGDLVTRNLPPLKVKEDRGDHVAFVLPDGSEFLLRKVDLAATGAETLRG